METAFHYTTEANYDSIFDEGLVPQRPFTRARWMPPEARRPVTFAFTAPLERTWGDGTTISWQAFKFAAYMAHKAREQDSGVVLLSVAAPDDAWVVDRKKLDATSRADLSSYWLERRPLAAWSGAYPKGWSLPEVIFPAPVPWNRVGPVQRWTIDEWVDFAIERVERGSPVRHAQDRIESRVAPDRYHQ